MYNKGTSIHEHKLRVSRSVSADKRAMVSKTKSKVNSIAAENG